MIIKLLLRIPLVCVVILSKIVKAKHFSVTQKFQLYCTMLSLWIKAAFANNSDQLIQQKVMHYKISAYGYHNLFDLLDEIFLRGYYYFNANTESPKIIDCGANIGISALYFKFLFPTCKVHCFEPNPTAFELLKQNVLNNKLEDVVLHHVALSDQDSLIDFYIGESKGSFISSIDNTRGGTKIQVQAKQLSTLLSHEKVDLIKIDVEGAEWEIIRDLNRAELLDIADQFIIEYHHNPKEKKLRFSRFLEFFEDKQYTYSLVSEDEKSEIIQCVLLYIHTK